MPVKKSFAVVLGTLAAIAAVATTPPPPPPPPITNGQGGFEWGVSTPATHVDGATARSFS